MNTTKIIWPNIIGVCDLGFSERRYYDKNKNLMKDNDEKRAIYVSRRYTELAFQFISFDEDGDPIHCKTISPNMVKWIEEMRKECAEWGALEALEGD